MGGLRGMGEEKKGEVCVCVCVCVVCVVSCRAHSMTHNIVLCGAGVFFSSFEAVFWAAPAVRAVSFHTVSNSAPRPT